MGEKLEFGGWWINLGFVGHKVCIIEGRRVLFKRKRIKNYKHKIRSWALERAQAREGPWSLCFLSSIINLPQIKEREKKIQKPKFKNCKFSSPLPYFVTGQDIYSHRTSISYLANSACDRWHNEQEFKDLKLSWKWFDQ